ncbi:MAG TPA: hypothetical protein VHX88_15790 [Solirubrobacteraceae bacterium]|jgi:hypothetical protein|nr:hypothetical protein [Solirubrobacteraceae bacterium]
MRSRGPALIATAGALALAGCGSSHNSTVTVTTGASPTASSAATTTSARAKTSATPPVSGTNPAKQRYLSHFSANCTKGNQVIDKLQSETSKLTTQVEAGNKNALKQLAELYLKIANALASGVERQRKLGTPPGPGSKDAQAYIADEAVTALAFERIAQGLATGNLSAVNAGEKAVGTVNKQITAAAKAYGIPTCGNSTPSSKTPSSPAIASNLPAV